MIVVDVSCACHRMSAYHTILLPHPWPKLHVLLLSPGAWLYRLAGQEPKPHLSKVWDVSPLDADAAAMALASRGPRVIGAASITADAHPLPYRVAGDRVVHVPRG